MKRGSWKEFPDDADGDVLRSIQAKGVDLDEPRDVDFYCYVPNRSTGEQIAERLDATGFGSRLFVDDEDVEPEERISVYATKRMILDYDLLIRTQVEVNEVLAPFGIECDGWGTLVDPEERDADRAREAAQRQVCAKWGSDYVPAGHAEKAGVAENVMAGGIYPINGLRHPPVGDTCGWYIWAGEEMGKGTISSSRCTSDIWTKTVPRSSNFWHSRPDGGS